MHATVSDDTADANPLLAPAWDTPFGVPPFDLIRDEHFMPALREAMEAKRVEIDAIAASAEPPTFANAMEAFDRAGRLLERVEAVFFNLNSADTNPVRQAIAKEVAPLQAALTDDICLNPVLFARIKALWNARDTLGLDPVQAKLLEDTHRNFLRGGADLGPAERERFRAINQELAALSVQFNDNVLAETNGYRLVIDDPADLAGLPERVVKTAAVTATKAGLDGKWVFTLHWPSLWPFMEAADNRALRQKILAAYAARGANGDEHDNRAIITRIAALRAERANLLGYTSHAAFMLEERMAKTPDRVDALLEKIWKPALAQAGREATDLQAAIDASGGGFKLEAADWRYYTEKVRKARFAFDDAEVRPYFPLTSVRAGAFEVARRLYGITFTPRPDIPVYHPEVEAFEVRDADGSHLGVFYTDFFPRPGKRAGAWSSAFRRQYVDADGRDVRPVTCNTCNFSRPVGDAPALLSIDEVETLFHEFGHALHRLFQRVRYNGVADVPSDFVELPSQVMENWAFEPEVLALYAHHYQTGATIPAELIAKIEAAQKFGQGFATVEYTAAALLDMAWHTWTEPRQVDADAFEKEVTVRIGLVPEIYVRYKSPYFAHIFSGGYSAGYYSYMWSEVLDADAFQAFKETSLFDAQTALAFRREILERGGSADAMELYKAFRGREPRVEPLLERRGLN